MIIESKDRAALREMLACFADLGGTRGPRASAVANARAALARSSPYADLAEALRQILANQCSAEDMRIARAALAKVQS